MWMDTMHACVCVMHVVEECGWTPYMPDIAAVSKVESENAEMYPVCHHRQTYGAVCKRFSIDSRVECLFSNMITGLLTERSDYDKMSPE